MHNQADSVWVVCCWPVFTSMTYTCDVCSLAYLCFLLCFQWLKSVGTVCTVILGTGLDPKEKKSFPNKCWEEAKLRCGVAALLLCEGQNVVWFHWTSAAITAELLSVRCTCVCVCAWWTTSQQTASVWLMICGFSKLWHQQVFWLSAAATTTTTA